MLNKTVTNHILRCNSISYFKPYINYSNFERINSSPFNFSILNLQYVPEASRNTYLLNRHNLTIEYNSLLSHFVNSHVPNTTQVTGVRHYCTNKQPQLPKLMDFPQVVWPSVFKSMRNWILSNFIIMRYFDSEFSLPEFVEASKQVN